MPTYPLVSSAVPCLFDADLSALSIEQLQSGMGYKNDIMLEGIVPLSPMQWSPIVNHGWYFIGTERYYFPSNNAIRLVPQESGQDIFLPKLPIPGEPITVITYYRDDDGNIRIGKLWRQKARFTGTITIRATSATENIAEDEDGNIVAFNIQNADLNKDECVLVFNPNVFKTTVSLPKNLAHDGEGVVSIALNPAAKVDMPLIFSEPVVFAVRTSSTPSTQGEWKLSGDGSTLFVYSTATATQAGKLTYYNDYPAALLFAKDYSTTHGELSDPQNIEDTEIVGTSNGQPNLCFFTEFFPWLPSATPHVFIVTDGPIELTIVEDFSDSGPDDLHCVVDKDQGLIKFGDGINGFIPYEGCPIGAVYTSAPLVFYESKEDGNIIGSEVNLHPLISTYSRGFLYIQHHIDILNQLTLSSDKSTINCGNEYAILTCEADNPKNSPLSNVLVTFVHDTSRHSYFNALDYGVDTQQVTDSNGEAQTILHPPNSIMKLAETIQLYDVANNYLSPYTTTTVPNDTLPRGLSANEVFAPDYSDPIYTFLVLDSDAFSPYDISKQEGGLLVLLYKYDAELGNFVPVKPLELTETEIIYPGSLPTPSDFPALRQIVVAIPRISTLYCTAIDPLSGRLVTSNLLNIKLTIPPYQMGPFTLRQAINSAGSSIDSATYITIDKMGALNAVFQVSPVS